MESLKRKTDKMRETDNAKRICAAPLCGRVTVFVERTRTCTNAPPTAKIAKSRVVGAQSMKRSNIYRVEF